MSFSGPVDESDGVREIYVSKANFEAIVTQCPHWVQVIVLCFYMTGMRANEALVTIPEHVDLDKRIIRLRKDETANMFKAGTVRMAGLLSRINESSQRSETLLRIPAQRIEAAEASLDAQFKNQGLLPEKDLSDEFHDWSGTLFL